MSSPRVCFGGFVVCAFAAVLTWLAITTSAAVVRLDLRVFDAFRDTSIHVGDWADRFAISVDPIPYAFFTISILAIALARNQLPLAVAAAALLLGSALTTHFLKAWLTTTRAGSWNINHEHYWPSGHTTAAMAIALSLVLVLPRFLRPMAAAIGSTFAAAVIYSLLIEGFHLPSDTFAGIFIATGWALFSLGVLSLWERKRGAAAKQDNREVVRGSKANPQTNGSDASDLNKSNLWPTLGLGILALIVLILVLAVVLFELLHVGRFETVSNYLLDHKSLLLGLVALGGLIISTIYGLLLVIYSRS